MKMNELSMLLDDLISCGQKLTETAQALKEYYSSTNEDAPAKEEPKVAEPEPMENAPAEAPFPADTPTAAPRWRRYLHIICGFPRDIPRPPRRPERRR